MALSLGHRVSVLAKQTIFLGCIVLSLLHPFTANTIQKFKKAEVFPGHLTHEWRNTYLQCWTVNGIFINTKTGFFSLQIQVKLLYFVDYFGASEVEDEKCGFEN